VLRLLVFMARKVDKVDNFDFVQLIEQEPGIYDKCHPDYGRRDIIDLAWERISHEVNESGMYMYIYFITKTYNRIQLQNRSVKAMQTTTTIWPCCVIQVRS
jgi:hypothetical protein